MRQLAPNYNELLESSNPTYTKTVVPAEDEPLTVLVENNSLWAAWRQSYDMWWLLTVDKVLQSSVTLLLLSFRFNAWMSCFDTTLRKLFLRMNLEACKGDFNGCGSEGSYSALSPRMLNTILSLTMSPVMNTSWSRILSSCDCCYMQPRRCGSMWSTVTMSEGDYVSPEKE
jgi:hypothetical protein